MSSASATDRVSAWLADFGAALEGRDVAAACRLFQGDCYWRDLVAFTWNIVTCEGQAAVADMLGATLGRIQPHAWRIEGEASVASAATGTVEDAEVLEAWFTFETAAARGRGHVRLKDERCWTLLTTMVELKDHEERRGSRRELGTEHGASRDRVTWLERRQTEQARLGREEQPYCLVVGGGQGGIGLGARLRQLGVPTLIVDRHERPGDAWRKRYESLCLHDPVWYDHLPYLPFPDHWPVFSPKDKLGDWLEMYTKVMELNYWGSTICKRASYDEAADLWEVVVEGAGEELTLRPSQLVLATGMSGRPVVPRFPGADRFKGVQHHSSAHEGAEAYRGQRCVIIGSNNSAHDIAAALWEHAADVTMVQRSSTLIARSDSLMELATGRLYSEDALARGITTGKADLLLASMPYRLMPEVQRPIFDRIRERDAGFYRRLERAGFMLDFGEDQSGLYMKYIRRGSGYYIDVGASDLIASGAIRLKSGVSVRDIGEESVVLTDGAELPADLIVYATGYGSMNGFAAELISQEVADRVGKCWGIGSATAKDPGPWEGELRNMWKPTRQKALWFHGGNLQQSRHYSRYLALQLKARMEGIETPVYGLPEVHHLS